MSDDDKPTRSGLAEDPFKTTPSDQLTDLALLPHRFDHFAAEVRDSFRLLGDKILPAITRFEEALVDIGLRLSSLERHQQTTEDRLNAIEARLTRRPKRKK